MTCLTTVEKANPVSAYKMKSVSIITNGSRGDLQPFIAIALALQGSYNVRILSSEGHRNFVESFGLTHVTVIDCDEEQNWKESEEMKDAMATGNMLQCMAWIEKKQEENADFFMKSTMEELKRNTPSLLVVGTTVEFFHYYAKEILGIPSVRVVLSVIGFNDDHSIFGLPTLPDGGHNDILLGLADQMCDGYKKYDDALENIGYPTLRSSMNKEEFKKEMKQYFEGLPKEKTIVCQSAKIGQVLCPGSCQRGSKFVFTGPSVICAKEQKSENEYFGGDATAKMIDEFIAKDLERMPIYLGWGSMTSKSSEHMAEFACRSAMNAGQRAIILGGWAQLCQEALEKATSDEELIKYARDNILFVSKVSHENLFPRVSVIIHHGGAGTTYAALRSGVPSIITPVFFDQFDHARAIEELQIGRGFSKQLQQITAEELGASILQIMKDKGIAKRSKQFQEYIVQDNGAIGASAEIANMLDELEKEPVQEVARETLSQSHTNTFLREGARRSLLHTISF